MDTRLKGLTVLITGASGGIGEALAEEFANEGANLVLHGHSRADKLEDLVGLEGWGERALVGTADLRKPETLDELFEQGRQRFGRIDVVVANAGIWPPEPKPLHELSVERIREVIDVNLIGTIVTCRSFAAQLAAYGPRADGRGASVCLIGSTAGRFGEAHHLEYAVSKAGMYGLMRSLKNELVALDPWARVNLVEPGWTVTPMAEAALAEEGTVDRVCATMALRQLARPADVARAVVFLSSPALARHVSGEVITVAGGMEGRRLWEPEQIDPMVVRSRLERD
ncbi:SDR family NAD(P)-dependent oxidoreductase [Enhygromyxa salina]|uniref:3-oxoacyl-[acyl-carrier-protein] reductase FabG n=1 Tax=Enhygromyxa salina TaxID=215803 RepID=A0A2S9YTT8_9BACT|nr:SDR family oxidoreductase [Enhygromyxa salina]PRQ08503.1 3-oxoacyl-[acyl-carrier-protein] reductase FabG [Enhygromyxa salina]